MRIAVDVDGVLADHVPTVLSELRNEHADFNRTKSTMTHWDETLPTLGTSLKPEVEAAESDPSFVRNMEPVEGAIDATNTLADQGHELVIVTARPERILPVTHEWLEANGIPHSRDESLSTKGEMKTIADAAVLIDDFPNHIRSFAKSGKFGILFVQPWNRVQVDEITNHPKIFAAGGWEQVLDIIETLSEIPET